MHLFYKGRPNQSQTSRRNSWTILAVWGIFLVSPSYLSVPSPSSSTVHAASSSAAGPSGSSVPQQESNGNLLSSLTPFIPSDYQDDYPQVALNQQAFLPTWSSDLLSLPRKKNHQVTNSPQASIESTNLYGQGLQLSVSKFIGKDPASRSIYRQHNRRQEDPPSDSPSFPQPFDTSLGTDFESDTCEPFMSAFLRNAAFQRCHSFSLLLTTSSAFFHAVEAMSSPLTEANKFRPRMPVTAVLDAACQADSGQCEAIFNRLALDIQSRQIGCGKDLDKNNSLPLQALNGFNNYRMMRDIGCLTTDESDAPPQTHLALTKVNTTSNSSLAKNDTATGAMNLTLSKVPPPSKYCFEKAASSKTPDDLYYYYLALGTNLPSGTRPSCDHCTKSIMKLYSVAAANSSLGIQATYPSARMITNLKCGPGFAPTSVNPRSRFASHADRRFDPSSPAVLRVGIVLFTICLLLL